MDRETVGSMNRGRLQVEVRSVGRSEVVTPAGELDHHTAELLSEPLDQALERGRSRLVIDCSRLEFCDSTGLNVLLGARLKAEAAGEGFTWPGCFPWWPECSRSQAPRRSSPCTIVSKTRCATDPHTLLKEMSVVTIRQGRSPSAISVPLTFLNW